jgi:hypothetical protein
MKCPLEFDPSAELIVAYGARTLDPDAAAAFERHLDSCATCCKVAAAQKAVWDALDEWPGIPVSTDFDRRLFRKIQAARQRAWWWRALVPLTACLALASMLLLRNPQASPQPIPQIEQVQHALDDMDLLSQLGTAN